MLNLPNTQRTTQRWQSVRRSVGPALIGQAGWGGAGETMSLDRTKQNFAAVTTGIYCC